MEPLKIPNANKLKINSLINSKKERENKSEINFDINFCVNRIFFSFPLFKRHTFNFYTTVVNHLFEYAFVASFLKKKYQSRQLTARFIYKKLGYVLCPFIYLTIYGMYTYISLYMYAFRKNFIQTIKEIGVSRKCSIVLLVMPEEHHKRTILQRLLTLLYIIHHLILRATNFLQELNSKEHAATL